MPGGPTPSACAPSALGTWTFDDCNSSRTDLFDSSFNNFTAFRTTQSVCVPGQKNGGLAFPGKEDIAFVPDQQRFTFGQGMSIAAWVKPAELGGSQTLVRKREGKTSTFALMIEGKRFTFVIDRVGAIPVAVSAPAKKDVWTHVVATYDGKEVRLYLDGVLAQKASAPGLMAGGQGPLLFGNDGDRRRFEGTLDDVFFSLGAISPEQAFALTCIPHPFTLAVSPTSATVEAGSSATYNYALTNNDSAACGVSPFSFSVGSFTPDLFVTSGGSVAAGPGQTVTVPVTATSSPDIEPGTFEINVFVNRATGNFEFQQAPSVTYTALAGPCPVSTKRELMIRDLSVVDDPVRTRFDGQDAPGKGVWTFAHLMEQIAPSPAEAPAMVDAILHSFAEDQTINGFTVRARTEARRLLLDFWPRTKDGQLDLRNAPVQLLAIVNRLDLRNLAQGNAGEGRMVYGVLGPFQQVLEFEMIFEYKLPAKTEADVLGWANAWHELGALPFPSERYNSALEAITERFVSRGANPTGINGSALGQFRTNEISLDNSFVWQLREFTLNAAGHLVPATIKLTPDQQFNGSDTLSRWVEANQSSILSETHDVPESFEGAPFLGGAVFNPFGSFWSVPNASSDVRHKFSLNTCNGCHSIETNSVFTQIANRFPGNEAPLSGFLTGTTAFDPLTGQPRFFNDLGRRNRDLKALVCPGNPPPPVSASPDENAPKATVAKGANRSG